MCSAHPEGLIDLVVRGLGKDRIELECHTSGECALTVRALLFDVLEERRRSVFFLASDHTTRERGFVNPSITGAEWRAEPNRTQDSFSILRLMGWR